MVVYVSIGVGPWYFATCPESALELIHEVFNFKIIPFISLTLAKQDANMSRFPNSFFSNLKDGTTNEDWKKLSSEDFWKFVGFSNLSPVVIQKLLDIRSQPVDTLKVSAVFHVRCLFSLCVCVCVWLFSIIFCSNFFSGNVRKKGREKKETEKQNICFWRSTQKSENSTLSRKRPRKRLPRKRALLFKEEKFHSSCCRCRRRPPYFQPAALSLLRDGCWNCSFSLPSPTLQDLSSSNCWSQRHFNLQQKNWEMSCHWKCQLSFVSLWSVVEHLTRSTLFGRFHSSKHRQKGFPNFLAVQQDQVLRLWTLK